MVREDKIDILVELTGNTANNKLGMMACWPAPVQVTWIGYPNTTGLPAIDYRITDTLADPVDSKQKHVEELVRLPDFFLCYTPSHEAGPVSPPPALANGFVTFGSFNNLAKITPRVLQVWAKILCAVPNSRLIVKCKPFFCDSLTQQFLTTLEKLGLESHRVDLLPSNILNHDHMQAYSLMDISLDTFPYAGTTTTCESLYMGMPCVTMGGSVHAHNVGVSLLETVGLNNLVAKNEDEYVKMAVQLATDLNALSSLRMKLRDVMLKSPLCNGPKFIQGLESAFRNMCGEGTVRMTFLLKSVWKWRNCSLHNRSIHKTLFHKKCRRNFVLSSNSPIEAQWVLNPSNILNLDGPQAYECDPRWNG